MLKTLCDDIDNETTEEDNTGAKEHDYEDKNH